MSARCIRISDALRYLIKASPRPERRRDLLQAIEDGSLGQGSVAFGEYEDNMRHARLLEDGTVTWVEVCFCDVPLEEERPYWEEYVELTEVKDAHSRRDCRHENGSEPWACSNCDCTRKLEARLGRTGVSFLNYLR